MIVLLNGLHLTGLISLTLLQVPSGNSPGADTGSISRVSSPPQAQVVKLRAQKAPAFVMADQYERDHRCAECPGDVLVLIYGDRESSDFNKQLGEMIHLAFHPGAKSLPPEKARQAAPSPLPGQPSGGRCPDVKAVPVAVIGKAPNLVKTLLRNEFRKACPDCAVWMDFDGSMKQSFGLAPGVPNLVVIDGSGQVRMAAGGKLTREHLQELVDGIQQLRHEAVDK
ncbi:MAG: hypothetical protein DWH82_06715 [Planctomycetota bacterium]|nr:MAG: hypothetical protein DWH82_06715 [Planctomycetota bacterium]